MPPSAVSIREVGPRDGFQNEPETLPTELKIELIDALARTGLKRLEVTSFVRADVIPQLADAEEVLGSIDVPDDVAVSVLIPNERGLERALGLRQHFDEINCFMSASEAHNRHNLRASVERRVTSLRALSSRGDFVDSGDSAGRPPDRVALHTLPPALHPPGTPTRPIRTKAISPAW
jgi:hydroxymethylglutaryl-CoA lyase